MTFADVLDTVTEYGNTTGTAIKKGAKTLKSYDKQDILAAFGLEPKRSTLQIVAPAIGFLAVGVIAGVGLGMLFAPKPGYELREDLSEQMKNAVKKTNEQVANATDNVSPVI